MKIGIDGRALQQQPWGGVGQYTYNLLHALFKLDRENEYVVWYNAVGALEAPMFSEYPNVSVHRTRWPNKVLNAAIKVSGVRCQVSGVDLFFMPNLNFIALSPSTKLILAVHDLSFVHFPEHFSLKSRLWHRAVNPRTLFARANHVIAVSEHTQGDLVETYGIAPEKVTVIYPGIDQGLGARALGTSTSRNSRPYPLISRPYILYFGALEPRKNIEGIIRAYEMLRPREQLVLAGLSTPYVKRLKKRITQSKFRERISLIENPSEEEKAKLYAAAHLFVYPSFYEGFGFPPLEAMAYGVPVVASSASSVPEVCGDGALLVNPWKVEEIKEGMRILLENEALRQRYIVAGRARVPTFQWARSARETLDIFYKCSSGG